VDSLLLRRPHRSAREGAALVIDSSLVLYWIDTASASGGASRAFMLESRHRSCFLKLTRRLRVWELAEPLCSNHDTDDRILSLFLWSLLSLFYEA
jgi:hypothetical protein